MRANGVRSLVIAAVAAIAVLLSLSPSERGAFADVAAAATRGHVYLVRGIGNIFSLGMDSLADKLRAKGISESVSNHLTWSRVANKIVARYQRGRRNAPIVIVGHSLGGNAAIRMAAKLDRAGVPVRLLIIFDATNAEPIPANVKEAINYYKPGSRGKVLRPGRGFKGTIRNDDLKNLPALKHMNMDESATLHARVVAKVVRIMR